MATVFFSYSHKDEELRDRLETALATMKHQGLIESWHDRRLLAGDHVDHQIRSELERAEIILLLVSPDFIASDYCHDVEMARALERHDRGEARVIPVILRACDWHPMPFGKLLAVPRDGRPVKSWPDLDEAFLDIVKSIRGALPDNKNKPKTINVNQIKDDVISSGNLPRSSNLRLNRNFGDVEKDRYLDGAFEFMANYFEGSLAELEKRNEGIQTAFRRIDANRFTAVVYRDAKAVARCSIVLGGMLGRGIAYSVDDRASSNSYNENLTVENDEQTLFLRALGMRGFDSANRKLTFEGAAELYWGILIEPLQRRG